ncbi:MULTISPECIES: sensor histidine kinase [unclassified Blastococcus]
MTLRRELVAFVTVALVALFLVAAGTYLLAGRIARDRALREAEGTVTRLADVLIEPLISNVLDGEEEDLRDLDQVVAIRLSDGSMTRIVVWEADGEVVYSSDEDLRGRRIPPSPELTAAIEGRVSSDIDEEPETEGPGQEAGSQLEVYAPLDAGDRRLALEAYFDTAMVEEDADLLRWQAVPLALGALIVLQLLQFPIAASMGRRLSSIEAERTELIRRHFAASERERRAIAADVHDGPVQDLAGVSYGLAGLRPHLQGRQQASLDRMVTATRNAVASLRRLMTDIYPPDLSGTGLPTAMDDLGTKLREDGVEVEVEAETLPAMDSASAAVLYRTAKEALTNVHKHAGATRVCVRLEAAEVASGPAVRLVVEDDGVGLPGDGDGRPDPGEGHLGLRLVHERIEEAGGTVTLRGGAEGGTVLEAVLPVAAELPPS